MEREESAFSYCHYDAKMEDKKCPMRRKDQRGVEEDTQGKEGRK